MCISARIDASVRFFCIWKLLPSSLDKKWCDGVTVVMRTTWVVLHILIRSRSKGAPRIRICIRMHFEHISSIRMKYSCSVTSLINRYLKTHRMFQNLLLQVTAVVHTGQTGTFLRLTTSTITWSEPQKSWISFRERQEGRRERKCYYYYYFFDWVRYPESSESQTVAEGFEIKVKAWLFY